MEIDMFFFINTLTELMTLKTYLFILISQTRKRQL